MNKLQKYIIQALRTLIKFDKELIENQPKEECINHRFAKHLEDILKEDRKLMRLKINVDIEYDKYQEDRKKSSRGENIRPDIIVHKRKSGHTDNLIVIEAKKKYITQKDRDKISALVSSKQYNYLLGVGVAYLPRRHYVKIKFLLPNGLWENYQLNKHDCTIQKTRR